MATKPQPTPAEIPGFTSQMGQLQQQADVTQSKLSDSPSAYSAAQPTSADVSNQQELDKIQKSITALRDNKLKAQWYPPAQQNVSTDINPGGDVNPGVIGSTLDFLGRPVRAVVGAVKHFTGQGTGTLTQDMAQNMMVDKQYFGDVLAKAGVPGWIAAPLGFGLDIVGDPVNWATMGEAALIPKIAGGLVRGGVEGASAAAKAGVLEKAVTVGKYTPWYGTAFGDGTKSFAALGEKSLAATSQYENLTGLTAENLMQSGGVGFGSTRVPLSTIINKVAEVIPGGKAALSTLVYDPVDWVKQTVDMDIIKRSFGTAGVTDVRGAVKARLEDPNADLTPFMDQSIRTAVETSPIVKSPTDFSTDVAFDGGITQGEIDRAIAALPAPISERLATAAPGMTSKVDDVATINKDPTVGVTGDPLTNGLRILNETQGGGLTLEDVAAAVNSGALGDTGVKWFDGMMQSIKDFRSTVDQNGKRVAGIGEKTLKYYDQFMGLFRGAKVGGSPVGHMNALFGNAIMNHMGIGDIGPDYWARYHQIYDLYSNVPASAAKLQGQIMDAGVWGQQFLDDLKSMPTAVRGTAGEMPGFLNAKATADMLMQNLVSEAGKVSGLNTAGLTAEQIAPYVDAGMADLEKMRASLPSQVDRGVLGGTSIVRAMKGDLSKTSRLEIPTDIVSQEMFDKPAAREMFDYIAKRAKEDPKNPFWWAMDAVYNRMQNQYAKWDQISKMTTLVRSSIDGYTLPQLLKARNLIDIGAEDFSKVTRNGVNYYRLNARKGIELANALYMNYAAMPSAVRVVRNMPLVGSPFISFMYGMALKTGQTLAYNPSAFNKVNFAMSEFGGTPSPLEKRALNTTFYSYLKQPGMYRVPFTDANPIYVNVSNMIPYLSMNMFNPSTSNYTDGSVASSFANAVNASPFIKEPLGSTLFTNLILPSILSEGIQPQGQFGQAIWPSDADFLTKLGYTTRDLTEATVPGVGALAGLLGGLVAPQLTPFVPLYRYRNLANAVQGQNVYGITGKESIPSRTLRGAFSAVGVPVQAPVNLTYTQKQSTPAP